MRSLPIRPLRLLYVENDPALRKILGEILGGSKEIELIGSFAGGAEAIVRELVLRADIALIDFALKEND